MRNTLSTIIRQSSASNENGVGLMLIIGIISLLLIGAIAVTTPQMKKFILPSSAEPSPTFTPAPETVQLSEKQQLYLRNKERIQQELNLDDNQFTLLVESAAKN
jgi:hypothetical protein